METNTYQSTIILNYPVDMQKHVVTQEFGENPSIYKKYIVGGKPLEGHNGTDFGPLDGQSHDVWSVDNGRVVYVGYDPVGYGWYVDIQHLWGKSRYAHFSKLYVKVGDHIVAPRIGTKGQAIGYTGSTGFSTGIHLHLGIYPTGVDKGNGYGGAIDPRKPPPDGLFTSMQPSVTEPTTIGQSDISAGIVRVIAYGGLKLRKSPSKTPDTYFCILPAGTQIEVTNDTVVDGNILWRKVVAWVGEKDNQVKLIDQVSKTYSVGH